MLAAAFGLAVAGCEGDSGPGVGTVGGAALGAGAGRAIFGGSTSAMLIGGAVGGLAGNATLDRQAQDRRQEQAEVIQRPGDAATARFRAATRPAAGRDAA